MGKQPQHVCPNSAIPTSVLEALPRSQAGRLRHLCAACAWAAGRELALSRDRVLERLSSDTEACGHGFPVPVEIVAGLAETQAAPVRHLCAGCAFHAGLRSVSVPGAEGEPWSPALAHPTFFEPDVARRVALERHAMQLAKDFLLAVGCTAIRDVSSRESFDYVCNQDEAEQIVEVKGTVGPGTHFLATRNEVTPARTRPTGTWLIVVCEIVYPRGADGPRGGSVRSFPGWRAPLSTAVPVQFLCETPALAVGGEGRAGAV